MKTRLKTLLGLVAILSPLLLPVSARAATTPTPPAPQSQVTPGQGVSLTPALQSKVLSATDKSVSFTIQLANPTASPLNMSLRSTDFKALNQTGGLAFTGSDSKAVTEGNGLSNILRLESQSLTIPPRGSRDVVVRIDDVAMLAPGGHYAAVIAQVIPGSLPESGNNLAIYQAVSSLIFLETAGKGTRTLSLLPISFDNYKLSLADSINVTFKSTGNTQTVPRGIVTISRGKKEIQRGIINQDSSLLLPGSTRLLQTPLKGDTSPIWPGIYTLNVQYRYDGSSTIQTFSKRFVYINIQVIIGLLVGLVLIVLTLRQLRSYLKHHPLKILRRRPKQPVQPAPRPKKPRLIQ